MTAVIRPVAPQVSSGEVPSHYDVIVIGAGQAGLSAGYYLSKQDVRFTLLDAGHSVGSSWRNRWNALQLFTPARYSALPGMKFPGAKYSLPSKDDVANYLENYARHFALPIRFATEVRSLGFESSRFQMDTTRGRMSADAVIVATGANQRPYIPPFAAAIASHVRQIHSHDYRTPDQLAKGAALVVGTGNSGAQIALDLAATGRRVMLSGRDTGFIPRRWLGRDIYDWAWPTVMRTSVESKVGRRMIEGRLFHGDPLVGIPASAFKKAGIQRVGRTLRAQNGNPVVEDHGRVESIESVVWCTGFRPDYSWIELPVLGLDGYPRHVRGVAVDVPKLGFLGMRFQYRMRSALIGGVGEDAEHVVTQVLA